MAKLYELIDEAQSKVEGKEIELKELDNIMKDVFKTKNSLFSNVRDWIVNIKDGIEIDSSYKVQHDQVIVIKFKVIIKRTNEVIENMIVKVISIYKL